MHEPYTLVLTETAGSVFAVVVVLVLPERPVLDAVMRGILLYYGIVQAV
jgi:hypothetical protein